MYKHSKFGACFGFLWGRIDCKVAITLFLNTNQTLIPVLPVAKCCPLLNFSYCIDPSPNTRGEKHSCSLINGRYRPPPLHANTLPVTLSLPEAHQHLNTKKIKHKKTLSKPTGTNLTLIQRAKSLSSKQTFAANKWKCILLDKQHVAGPCLKGKSLKKPPQNIRLDVVLEYMLCIFFRE